MTKGIKYFNLQKEKQAQAEIDAERNRLQTRHVDFLLQRKREDLTRKMPKREHVVADDVARITEKTLKGKSAAYYNQLMNWRSDLLFKRFEQVRLIEDLPHLGYAAITSGTIPDKDGTDTPWILYFANFNAKFGKGDALFEDIPIQYGVTFFALALTLNPDGTIGGRDLRKRGNGVLFSTQDPTEAFESIVKLRDVQKTWQMVTREARENGQSLILPATLPDDEPAAPPLAVPEEKPARTGPLRPKIEVKLKPDTSYLFSV